MATDKYALPDYVTARVRYYNGQFLRDDDFIDEQRYQIAERRRHERLLHIAGVTEGLDITPVSGGSSVKIAAGSAIDDKGHAIRLEQDVTLPVSGNGQVYVELAFSEAETNPSDQNSSVQSNTRFTQNARPTLSSSRTAGTVLLAELSLTSSAITAVKLDNRVYSGLRLPGPAGAGGYLRSRGDATASWAEIGCSLSVKGDVLMSGGLSFGAQGRQMLNLYSTTYGAGTQTNTLYFRTDKNVAFYKGGAHDNTELSAGTGGVVQLAIKDGNVGIGTTDTGDNKLRVNGNVLVDGGLAFGSRNGQLLNLYSTAHAAGVQGSTTYFRSSKNFAFYKGGTHDNAELSAGTGGVAQLAINDGNVGIGTTAPKALLHVVGNLALGVDANNQKFVIHPRPSNSGDFLQITSDNATGGWDWANGITLRRGGNVAIGATDPQGNKLRVNGTLFVDGDTGVGGDLSLGSKNGQRLNLYSTAHAAGVQTSTTYFRSSKNFAFYKGGVHSDTELDAGTDGTAQLVINDGKVGIGTAKPTTDLMIRRNAQGALGPVLTLQNDTGWAGAGAAIDMNGVDPGANDPTVRIQSLDDGNHSSHLVFHTKEPGNKGANKLKERLRITSDGIVSTPLGRVVACKEETIRIVRGFVNSAGSIVSGSGFTVSKKGTGVYEITFSTAFASRPSVVAVQHYPGDNEWGGDTRDNATVVVANTDRARIKTGGASGSADDRHFCFMAIGT